MPDTLEYAIILPDGEESRPAVFPIYGIRWMKRKNTKRFTIVSVIITQMIISGTNPQDIFDMIRYDFGVAYNVAERLIRTEAGHAYNTDALESYKRANVKEV